MAPDDTAWSPSPRQQALISALAAIPFPSLTDAADTAKIPYQTAKNWNRDPRFRAHADAAREEAAAEHKTLVNRSIVGVAQEAVEVKLGIMRDKDANPYVRAQEATWFLERLVGKTTEHHDHTTAGQPIESSTYDLRSFTTDELRAIVARAATRPDALGDTAPEPR